MHYNYYNNYTYYIEIKNKHGSMDFIQQELQLVSQR
jgi:hypothetical protein